MVKEGVDLIFGGHPIMTASANYEADEAHRWVAWLERQVVDFAGMPAVVDLLSEREVSDLLRDTRRVSADDIRRVIGRSPVARSIPDAIPQVVAMLRIAREAPTVDHPTALGKPPIDHRAPAGKARQADVGDVEAALGERARLKSALQAILGGESQLQDILNHGLATLADNPQLLRRLLIRPGLLLDLQGLVFISGGPYWDRIGPFAKGLPAEELDLLIARSREWIMRPL
jgi:hypothetical protein